jgi:hypothetical protein
MADTWLPGFDRVKSSHGTGGSMVENAPRRWTGHSTQGISRDPWGQAAAHPTPPHCWVCPPSHPFAPKARIQIVPLNRSAFALKHNPGDPETNKQGAIQVEIEGFSQNFDGLPDSDPFEITQADMDWIADYVVKPMCEATGVKPSITWNSNSRMSWNQWRAFNGLHTHRNVPGNTHTDMPIDLAYISARLTGSSGSVPPEVLAVAGQSEAVAQNQDGRWECFKVESTALRDSWQTTVGGSFSGWATVDSTQPWQVGSLVAVQDNSGRINVWGRKVGTDERLLRYQLMPNGGTGWSPTVVFPA